MHNETNDLIKQREALAQATALKIAALLKERTDLDASTEARQAAITDELKTLGYKRPRTKKAVAE